jgi:hypothetical protein
MPSFLTAIVRTRRYVLYQAPTSGYATYGTLVDRETMRTQRDLFAINRAINRPWFNGTDPASLRFHRFDFPASANAVSASGAPACEKPAYGYERVQPGAIRPAG